MLRIRYWPLVLLLSLGSWSCASISRSKPTLPLATERAPYAQEMDRVLEAALSEQRIVGAVLLIAQDGQVVYHRAVGYADRENAVPMREETIFRYASLSKPLVAATALALIDRHQMQLDDPVDRYLPDFQPHRADGTLSPPITIRQLLTHTSGLGYTFTEPEGGPYHRAGVSDGLNEPGLSFAENLRRLVSVPLRAEPGTAFHYSLSTDVLGEVIARVGHASLPEMVARYVTFPLGMERTGFYLSSSKNLAVPYYNSPQGAMLMQEEQAVPLGPSTVVFSPSRVFNTRSYPSGGAGMVGTAGDYLVFLEAVRNQGRGILDSQTVELCFQNQLGQADNSEILGDGVGFGFLSAVVTDPARAQTLQKKGSLRWGGAYGHSWFVDRESRLSVVLLTNTAFEGMAGKLPDDIQKAIYQTH